MKSCKVRSCRTDSSFVIARRSNAEHVAEIAQHLFAQLIGEGDEYPPVTFPLVRREGEDAGEVVPEVGVLLLAEVPYRVEPVAVHLGARTREQTCHAPQKKNT